MSLEDIKARAEKATEGPWWVSQYGLPSDVFSGNGSGDDRHVAEILWNKDAAFIAHARQDIPKLVDALEAVGAVMFDLARTGDPCALTINDQIWAAINEALA